MLSHFFNSLVATLPLAVRNSGGVAVFVRILWVATLLTMSIVAIQVAHYTIYDYYNACSYAKAAGISAFNESRITHSIQHHKQYAHVHRSEPEFFARKRLFVFLILFFVLNIIRIIIQFLSPSWVLWRLSARRPDIPLHRKTPPTGRE